MRRLLTGVIAGGLIVLAAQAACRAAPAAAPGTEEFDALKNEFQAANAHYNDARRKAMQVLDEAKTDADKAEAQKKLDALDADGLQSLGAFAPRFLNFAAGHADSPAASEALGLALQPAAARHPNRRPGATS